VGASTHAVAAAAASSADFVFFGPVFATPSKRERPPQGEAALREAVIATPRPVLAIGGVDATVAARVRATGAHGVAVIRAILAAPDPGRATHDLLANMR
jgi:thiamine-phosphate diphosphorylase